MITSIKYFIQTRLHYSLFLFITSTYFCIYIIRDSVFEFNENTALSLIFFSFAIISLQTIIVFTIDRYFKKKLGYILATLFFSCNLFTSYILHFDIILSANIIWVILYAIFVSVIFYTLIVTGRALIINSLAFFLVSLSAYKLLRTIFIIFQLYNAPLPANYEFQEFKINPSIYMLSFDALAPEKIVKQHFGNEYDVRYNDFLKELGALRIKNAFANSETSLTMNSILSLDPVWWDNLIANKERLVTGAQPNAIYDLLQKNNYQTYLLYRSNYFDRGGDIKTQYIYASHKGFCTHKKSPLVFWGYCSIVESDKSFFTRNEEEQFIEDEFKKIVTEHKKSKFIMMHTYYPGHTLPSYNANNNEDRKEYKKHFTDGLDKVIYYMKEYISHIQQHDPNSIIIIYGDHGMHITKKAKKDLYTPKQIFQDRYAIHMSIINPTNCRLYQKASANSIYHIMHNMMKCLAGGKDVLKQPLNTSLNFNKYLYD